MIPAALAERAQRHGLVRRDSPHTQPGWWREGQTRPLVACTGALWWWADEADELRENIAGPFDSESAALSAALDWLERTAQEEHTPAGPLDRGPADDLLQEVFEADPAHAEGAVGRFLDAAPEALLRLLATRKVAGPLRPSGRDDGRYSFDGLVGLVMEYMRDAPERGWEYNLCVGAGGSTEYDAHGWANTREEADAKLCKALRRRGWHCMGVPETAPAAPAQPPTVQGQPKVRRREAGLAEGWHELVEVREAAQGFACRLDGHNPNCLFTFETRALGDFTPVLLSRPCVHRTVVVAPGLDEWEILAALRAMLSEAGAPSGQIPQIRCRRCMDSGRVSTGALWGPRRPCPDCAVSP